MEHANLVTPISRRWLLVTLLALAPTTAAWAQAETPPAPAVPTAPAAEAPKPAEPAPAPTPEAPKPAEPAPAPTPEAPKPAEPAPAPTPEAPKPAEPAPTPTPEAPKPAEPAPAPTPEAPKPAEPAPTPTPEAPKPAEPAPTPTPEAPKPAEPAPAPTPEAPKPTDAEPASTSEAKAGASKRRAPKDAAEAEADVKEKQLRFTFRYQRWADVLEWFAEQADLSLVMDAPPPGSFNYSDSREYPVSEALDLLNSVLLTKGYTLIRRERMLTLIDLSGEFPEGLIPKVTVEEAKKRGKHELVTVELDMGRREPDMVTAAVQPLLGPYHKLLAVAPTKQLFVTDRAGVVSEVSKVVESLPERKSEPPAPPPPKPEPKELKIYPIDKANPEALMAILEKLVAGAQLVYDPNLNQLDAHATATQHTVIQAILDQVNSAAAVERERRVDVYRLDPPAPESGAGAKLVEAFKAIVPKATVSIQEDGAAMIVWASPAEHETIKAAMSKLGGGFSGDPLTSPQLEMYRLTRVDPTKLIEMLEKLVPDAKLSYDERSRSLIALAKPSDQQAIRATLEQVQAEGDAQRSNPPRFETYDVRTGGTAAASDAMIAQVQPLVPEAKLTFDARTNRLVVYGTEQEQQLVKAALEKLGMEKAAADGRTMEAYPLDGADLTATQTLLQQLVPLAEFTPDATQQRLYALAAAADHERIKTTLEKLRPNPADPQAPQLRFYPFELEPPADVLDLLAKIAPQAKITVDKNNERLMVVAPPTSQTAVETAFQQFQKEKPAKGKPELATYPLKSATATGMAEGLQTRYPQAQIVLDATAKRLLVWASPEDHALLKAEIEKLQAEPAAEQQPQFEIHELRPGAAATVETAVTQLQSVVPEAKITADARANRLIVYGTAEEQQRVKAALDKLGLAKAAEDDRTMEAYPLAGADLTATQTLLQQMTPLAEFTADVTQQRLIVVASAADHERIKTTLEKLRPNPADPQAPQLRFYPFEQTPPPEVLELLAKVDPQAKITVDADNERLMVLAPANSQTAIETAFQQFQKATPAKGEPELATYTITSSDPASLLELLKARYPKAQLVLDAPNKRLLVWAPPEEQAELATSIKTLEAAPAAEDQPRFESYPLHGFATAAEASTLLASLQPLVPNARFTNDSKVKNLIVWAAEKEHEIVRRALERLGQGQAPQNTPQLEIHRLVKVDADTTLALLQKLTPDAQLTLDAKSNNLIALAVPADQQLIRATLEQLQPGLSGDAGPAVRFHPLVREPAEGLLSILKQMVPAAEVTPDAENKRLIAVATAADHEAIQKIIEQYESSTPPEEPRKLAVYPVTAAQKKRFEAVLPSLQTEMPGLQLLSADDPGALTVWARPSEQLKIAELIQQLKQDVPETEQLQLVAYTCAVADPTTISTFVTTLFPDAKFVVDAKSRRILVWARPEDHEKIKPALEQLGSGAAAGDFQPQFQAYSLSKVDPTVAVPLLQEQLPDAKIVADATSKRVLVWASTADHVVIAKAIEQLQSGADDQYKPRLVVYPRGEADPQTLLQMLTSLVPTARLAVDAQTGGLAAWATPDDQETIRKAVEEMSKEEVTASKPTTKAYTLQHITATAALPVLTAAVPTAKVSVGADDSQVVAVARPREHQMLQAILQEIDGEGAAATKSTVAIYKLEYKSSSTSVLYALSVFRSAFPKASFTLGSDPGEFVAWASAKDHEGIQALVDRLNTPPAPEHAPKVALYPLKNITATSALPVLQAAVPRATFTADPADPQRLTASGRPTEHEMIKTVLAAIDVEGEPGSQPSVVVYQLKQQVSYSAMSYAISLLTQAFPRARVLMGAEPGQFVAWASAKDHEGIQVLVDQLNAGPPPEEAPLATVYSLKNIAATTALTLLTTAVPKAKISSDAEDTHRLTAYASPADQAAIKQILEQIDVEGDAAGGATVAVYKLEGSTAATSLYYTLSVFRTAFPKATFSLGAEADQFVAWATAKEHEGIKTLVDQLNAAPAPEETPKIAVYPLQWINATTATTVLQAAVPKAKFTADTADPQRLTVLARPADQERIKAMLAELDVEGEGGGRSSVAVYVLDQQTSPTSMSYAISLLTQAFPRARFLLGTEPGQFVAWATAKDQQDIKSLVDRLNAGPPPEEAPVATVYSLQHITATTALTLLTTAVPKAKISSDAEDTHRLTAYASPADQAAIKQILEQIDVEGDAAGGATVAVYKLEGSTAATSLYYTLSVFRTAFPKATFSLGAEADQFVAWATAKEHEGIKTLVDQLNAAPAPEETPKIAVYPLQWINATTATTVLQAAVPKAKFTADTADPQRLTVLARPADQERIKAMLAELDVEGEGGGRQSAAVYRLQRQASPTSMSYAISLLTQAFPRARFLTGSEPNEFVAWASAKDHEDIQALVDRLNAGPPPEEAPVATVYSLKNILATTALSVLTPAVPQAKLTPDAQDTRRLTAFASPADQTTIKAILDKIDIEADAAAGETVAVYALEGQTSAIATYYALSVFRTAFAKAVFSVGTDPGQFIAWASAKDHEGIKKLVEQVNAGLPAEQKPQVELYTLKSITAASAAAVLQAAVPKAVVTVDPANAQRLTASARAADHEMIKAVLLKIDVEGEPETEPSVVVYELEQQGSPTAMSSAISMLTQAFPRARFVLGTEVGQFVAWATAKDQEEIKALVDRLNAGPPPEKAPVATVYSLKNILAATAVTVLTEAVPRAKLTPDTEDTRRLTAYASPEDQTTIKAILDKIDVEGDLAGGETVAVYQLESQAIGVALYYRLALFREAFPRATFSTGNEPGQFVAWASARDHAGIKALVEQINAGMPLEQRPQVVLYTLKFITGTAASQVLQTAVPNATFTTDPDDPQRLTASARAADHETIKTVLDEIDVEGEGGGRSTVQVYKLLGKQPAASLAAALQLLTTAFPRARFSPGTEPDQFVAWASPRDHQDIQALVERLNAAPPPDEASQAAVYTLKEISATTAISILRSAVPRATLSPDASDPQRLTAYATPLEQTTIKDILQQIDKESDPDASYSVAIYTMEGMSTRSLYYTGMFLTQVVPQAKFTPGSEEGQLVVWATAKDHVQIKSLIEQLQKAPPPELARTIKVYTLQHITAAAVIPFLQSAVRRADVTTDPADAQRLNAWATPADHKTIEEVLKQMDVKPDPESAPTAAVYQLEGMSQSAVFYSLRFLRDAVPRASYAIGGEGGQIVVWARAQDHETIKGLIKQLVEESPDATRTAQVYSLHHATATTALQALTRVVPQAALSTGADPSQFVAFASPRDHAKIADVLKELDKEAPPETEPQAVVYTLQSGNATEAMRILRTAVPTASLSPGAEPHQMIAWARPADHKIIQQIVERLAEKGPAELARKVAVYTLDASTAATAMAFLQNAVPAAQFSVGSDPRRLIAWATPADHEAIKKAVDEMETGTGQMTSQVYRFRYADPQAAYTVLQTLVPAAKMAVDAQEGSLVVSGLPEDHVKIKATIDQMDGEDAEGQRPALKIHRVAVGSVTNVYRSLALLFRNDATIQLSLDMDNDAVIAVAAAAKQDRIAELIKSMEDAARHDAESTMELYSLRNVDSTSAMDILEQTLDKQGSKAELSIDRMSNQLIAIARPEVHEQITKVLEQLRGEEPELEIYDLKYVDPSSAEMAILRQFTDEARAPEVSTDPVTQQLFIRATAEQQQQIRDLLIKMGETGLTLLRGRSSQNMRTVPFQGDAKAALEEIRRIWPKLRDNEIRVVSPDQAPPPPAAVPKNKPAKNKTSQRSAPPCATEFASVVQQPLPYSPPTSTTSVRPTASEPPAASVPVGRNKVPRSSVAAQNDKPADEPAPAPDGRPQKTTRRKTTAPSPPRKAPSETSPTPPPETPRPESPRPESPRPESPAPIYVVPSDGSITVVCDDPEALEQFEKLLRAMSGGTGEIGRNLSVYELKHSNAVEMAEKLRELYDTRRTSFRWATTEVRIVPDERLNRILVQGNRIDRETIGGLIRALDTEEGTGSKPQIVPVRFADADEIVQVVREVFRSQMTRFAAPSSNGFRSSSRSRVTPEIAVDPATNSLIVMAPSPLLDEILKLINSLDQAAQENPARNIKIITLQKTNTRRVEDALQRILRSSPTRAPRPSR